MKDKIINFLKEKDAYQKGDWDTLSKKMLYQKHRNFFYQMYEDEFFTLEEFTSFFDISGKEFMEEYASFKGMDYTELSENVLENTFLKNLAFDLFLKLNALPFKEDDEYIYVAISKPCSTEELDKIQGFFKQKFIKINIANPLQISTLLKKIILKRNLQNITAHLKNQLKNTQNEDKSAVSSLFELIIFEAIKMKASDVHIEPYEKACLIRFRIDGVLSVIFDLEIEIYQALILYIKLLANLNLAESRKAQDGSFSLKYEDLEYDFRLSSLPLLFGESLVIRILEHKQDFLELKKLHFEDKDLQIFKNRINAAFGLILLTGPTGSGKSTTLYASLNEIKGEKKKIITAEDPIEYKLSLIQQISLNEKAGLDFNNALRAILRQDPDVIMIGEIRDEESLDIAIKASLTGHLVFSTLHTNDSISAIARMLDMNAKPYLLASALSVIIAQRLVRKLCTHCRVKSSKVYPKIKGEFYEARGCEYCNMSGYFGRELIAEFIFVDENLSELVRQNASRAEIFAYLQKQGFESMFEKGIKKARIGITSIEEILRVVR